jgi:hypothetical protein
MNSNLPTAARLTLLTAVCLAASASSLQGQAKSSRSPSPPYFGFDRNDYPGDANLKNLRRVFSFSSYWLNLPPGATANSWIGKRQALQDAGFGFLVLFTGRTDAQIKSHADPAQLGASDAATAVAAARAEGFPLHTILFLDLEEGGRQLPEQRTYLHAWIDGVIAAHFAPGVYCSGLVAREASGAAVVTADDIRQNAGARKISYWVASDSCPPSPGCTLGRTDLAPDSSGIPFADVWQFSQSPMRHGVADHCSATYNKDGNCYPPGFDPALKLHVDMDVATSGDPSQGRSPN